MCLLTCRPAWGARTECGCCPCSRGCGAPARRCGGLGSKCTLTFSISKDFSVVCYNRYLEILEINIFELSLASFWRRVEKHWGLSEPSPGSLRQDYSLDVRNSTKDWGDHHDLSNIIIFQSSPTHWSKKCFLEDRAHGGKEKSANIIIIESLHASTPQPNNI